MDHDGECVDYAHLAERVDVTREALWRLGVRPGHHVATAMGLSIRWAEVLFACLDLGAVVVPMNLTWTADELRLGLELTDAEHVIVESRYRQRDLIELLVAAVASISDGAGGEVDGGGTAVRSVIGLRSEGDDGALPGFCADLDAAQATRPHAARGGSGDPHELHPEHPALMLLTSGSTSFPKAAVLSHRALLAGLAYYADGLELDRESVFVNCAPSYHIAGILTLCTPLMRGSTVVAMRSFEPAEAMRLIHERRATHFWGFDTHFAMMREHVEYGMWDLSSVEHTLAASNPGAAERILEMGFSHHGCVYGSTEYMGSQSFFPRRDIGDRVRMVRSHGRATSGELRIVDPETGAVLGAGEPGEICVRGPGLFSGYYRRPAESAACMDADGFFHSGDRGYLDTAGYLYYQGRYKEMIKSGGENVSILEVEQWLANNVDGVRNVAVFGAPHERWGEAVTAAIVRAPGTALTEADVVAQCRGRLAPYKIPKRVVFIDAEQWSVTPTGKIDRGAIRSVALGADAL